MGILVLAVCAAPLLETQAYAQSETPVRYGEISYTPYHPFRLGYESLPVKVVGVGGGRLGPNERFRIFASCLKNATAKSVTAVKFSYFVFGAKGLGEVLEKGDTALIAIDLRALETRKVEIQVVYTDEILLFRNKPGEKYRIELAVTEVHYDDGSTWQGTDLPQKFDPTRTP